MPAIPVVGHIGLTPQSVDQLGGYKPQGRTAVEAHRLLEDARALERVGCVAIVLEAIPQPVAAQHHRRVDDPDDRHRRRRQVRRPGARVARPARAGRSAGRSWHRFRVPKFVKQYADLGPQIVKALEAYIADVQSGRFPAAEHTYSMPDDERERFETELESRNRR